jgi:hypothetical protein
MATLRYGGAEYSYPGAGDLAEAIRRYVEANPEAPALLSDDTFSFDATFDYTPPSVPAILEMPDGTIYEGTLTGDVFAGATFTPTGKRHGSEQESPE